jgi:hypothetical protein
MSLLSEERVLSIVSEALGVGANAGTLRDRGFSIEVKALPTLRLDDLLGRLAHGILQLQSAGARSHRLVVVATPHVSRVAIAAARGLMREHGAGAGWALIGRNGDVVVEAPSLGVFRERLQARGAGTEPKRAAADPFSDLNAWMLKVLLLRNAQASLWGGPRASVASAAQLADVAGVSAPTAFRFVHTFEEMDFVRKTGDGLAVVRRHALLDAWLESSRLTPKKRVHARMKTDHRPANVADVFTAGVFARHKRRVAPDEAAVALAGFDACRALGVAHTNVDARPELHVAGDAARIFERYKLEPCDAADADFTFLPAKEAVLRGCVEHKGVECVDALQAALDVVAHPARGREQAEHIIEGVLGWSL